jgi:ribosomal-protein-alanine N-acetyltransferase
LPDASVQGGWPPEALAGRVRLVPLSARDRDEFIAAMQASRHLHDPWISPPSTPEEFALLLARTREAAFATMLVRRRDDGALAGYFNLGQIIRGPLQSAFLAYAAVAAQAGRGYMTEGMRLLLAYAFGDLGLHRVEANIQPGNAASRALVERSGFTLEGFSRRYLMIGGDWRDHERWAMLAEDWGAPGGLDEQ